MVKFLPMLLLLPVIVGGQIAIQTFSYVGNKAVHSCCFAHQVRAVDSQCRDSKFSGDSFWSKLEPVKLDTAKLEHLFESKSKEMPVTKVNIRSLNGGLLSHCSYQMNLLTSSIILVIF